LKKYLLFSALLLMFPGIYGQTVKVFDKTTLQPLPGIQIVSGDGRVAVSNARGEADISAMQNSDSICFSHMGYKSLCLSGKKLAEKKFRVALAEMKFQIDEIVVSANRWEEKEREIPVRIEKISRREIALTDPQTAADLLERTGFAYIQKSQLAGGSPMLRGFSTNRILLVVDGVRMNNAIFRSGNLQNVISLDGSSLDEAEILFGPGAVMYGSDAIGGVMDFHTLKPVFADSVEKNVIKASAFVRHSTANSEKTAHADVIAGFKKLALVSSFTWSDFGDLRAGSKGNEFYLRPWYQQTFDGKDSVVTNSNPSLQVNSGYSQMNLLQKIGFRFNDYLKAEYSFHYSATSDAPRYDRLILDANSDEKPDNAEWYYGPQKWMMNRAGLLYSRKTGFSDNLRLTVAMQQYEESRHDRKFGNTRLRHQTENVDALSVNVDADKKAGEKTTLFYGSEYVHNLIGSEASRVHMVTGEVSPVNTRYPNGSTWETFGLYAGAKYKMNEKIILNSGIRYSYFASHAVFDTSMFPFPFTEANNASGSVNGNAGLVYHPERTWKIYISIATGFRAPNMDDIGKVFESEPGSVVVPNAMLKPEYAYNAEAGFAKIFAGRVQWDATGYYTLLDNAIVRRPFSFNGVDSIMYDGQLSAVQAMQNIAMAYVYGIQTGIEINAGGGFEIKASVSYQKGKEQSADSLLYYPKNHVAPLFGNAHLIYKRNKLLLDACVLFNGKMDYDDLPLTDRSDHYIFAKNSEGKPYVPAWQTYNLRMSYFIHPSVSVSAGVENISDRVYRTYASGITAPGRNFVITLRGRF
jgi:hemoglobin/transferrin/lactoferrin receptor protein